MTAVALTGEEYLELIRSSISYDPLTGEFHWLKKVSVKTVVGQKAGSLWPNGYWAISVYGKRTLAHRWAWFITHGEWPVGDIDHINGVKTDNRLSNLRLASRSQNMANTGLRSTNKSGVKGVCWDKQSGRWDARIWKDGVAHRIGYFDDLDQAKVAYDAAASRLFGEFAWKA